MLMAVDLLNMMFEVHEHEARRRKRSLVPTGAFSNVLGFTPLLKVESIQSTAIKRSHNKRPLIDSYSTTRAVDALSLAACPIYQCLINTSVSI